MSQSVVIVVHVMVITAKTAEVEAVCEGIGGKAGDGECEKEEEEEKKGGREE